MSKRWTPNKFRYLEKGWKNDFLQQQENKLDADHQWQPKKDADPPIGGEYAIPIDDLSKEPDGESPG